MERKKISKWTFTVQTVMSKPVSVAVLVILVILVLAGTGCEQPERIQLRSRAFTPKTGIEPEYFKTLVDTLERRQKCHVYIQLKKNLGITERSDLEKQGVKLLSYIGSHTWRATVSDKQALGFTSSAAVKRSPVLGTVRWIGQIKPEDRVNPSILTKGVAPHSKGTGDVVYLAVSFYKDVPLDEAKSLINKAGGKIIGEIRTINGLQVAGPEKMIRTLINLDPIKWIDQLPPKGEDDNDELRSAISVNTVQAAPFNLDGTNVTIGQWETNNPDDTHDDFGTRVFIGDPPISTSDHATHVCGTLIGDGSRSAAEGGVANQWRGVATNASCISFRRHTVAGALDVAATNAQYTTALGSTHNMAISTNSWGTGHYHDGAHYDVGCEFYDQVIHGALDRAIPIVTSAGNKGPHSSGLDWGTVRIPNSAKNTIEVGNIFSDRDEISWSSSTGPTEDGRLKPDVAAPGDQANDDPLNPWGTGDKIKSCLPGDTYGDMSGTSMSTPAVSGVMALMLQQYRVTYWGNVNVGQVPLPSTYKAILCHTATDMTEDPEYHAGIDFEGPDYIYGYGLINAEAAVNAIRNARFLEGVIHSPTDEDIYKFDVAAGEDELKVTLAWDDVAASPGDALDNILKNDLDLILINPAGNGFYPPWELDPDNPENPADRNSYGTEATADAHRDELNVVEQVVVDNPPAGTWTIKVKTSDLPEPYQRYSIIAGDQNSDRLGGQVDIVQVLDCSGSMGGYASSGSTDKKINVLKQAASHFIELMKPNIGNQLGLVRFNEDVIGFSPAHQADLSILTGARATVLTNTTVPALVDNGCTSIGDGLNEALNQLTGPVAVADHDQVILLVTDGMENRSMWIDDVDDALIAADIAVYPLGLGYGYGINEAKLTDLADATGGTYRITSDELIFRKFFIEILAGAVNWAVVVDPVGELAAGEEATIPATITFDDTGATFTAYWEGFDGAITLSLISPSPSGTIITPTIAASNSQIRYGKHPRYAFYQLDFPLAGSLAGLRAGQWKMKLTGTSQIPSGQKARYSASAFTEGGTQLNVNFGKIAHLTGEAIPVKAQLMKDGKPILGAQINVQCNAPAVSVGNVLNSGNVTLEELQKISSINKDPISLIDGKLQILAKRAGRKDILPRKTMNFALFDDGKHGDGAARDGVYAASFTQSRIPGSYTFRVVASNIPVGKNLKTTREWTSSLYNRIDINPKYSEIDIRRIIQRAEDLRYRIKVAPKDRFGNYLGPGHRIRILISSSLGKHRIELKDNIDGTYTKDVLIPRQELKVGAKVIIEVDGQKFIDVTNSIQMP